MNAGFGWFERRPEPAPPAPTSSQLPDAGKLSPPAETPPPQASPVSRHADGLPFGVAAYPGYPPPPPPWFGGPHQLPGGDQ